MLGYCSDHRFVEHQTGPHHPERPDRIRAIARAVRLAGIVASPDPFPEFQVDLGPIDSSGPAALELAAQAADERWLLEVHSPKYVERIRRACAGGGGVLDQGDTPVGPQSFEIALLAVGSLLGACDAVMAGRVSRAFVAARPPGHHAEPSRPMGFCLFANVAIAARYLQKHHGLGRIAIVDFDVHHGNGTQACFEDDHSVLFISLHQHPATLYPGTGYEWETGAGAGEGFTLNVSFSPGAGDAEYMEAMQRQVVPKLDVFAPQVLLVSAGFDAHRDDPLAQIELSEDGFSRITRSLVESAKVHCGGRIISGLEGGYDLRALSRGVVSHLRELSRD